jgi:cytochrome c553
MSRHETEVSSSRRRRRGVVAPLALLLVGLCGSAAVQAQVSVPPAGRLLASNCFQCHGTNGSGGFERLAGMSAGEIANELREMRLKPVPDIMEVHARGYSDAQLQAIGSYFASLGGTTAVQTTSSGERDDD